MKTQERNTTSQAPAQTFIKLRRCAYILDDTASRFYCGNAEQIAKRKATEKALREYYDRPEMCEEWIPCDVAMVPCWDGEKKRFYIMLNGEAHGLNAIQIQAIKGEAESTPEAQTINQRALVSLACLPYDLPELKARQFCADSLGTFQRSGANWRYLAGWADIDGERFLVVTRFGEVL